MVNHKRFQEKILIERLLEKVKKITKSKKYKKIDLDKQLEDKVIKH